MGLFWELFQELQINKRREHANTIEQRIDALEQELLLTQDIVARTLKHLEQITGEDIDGDGQVEA